MFHGHLDYLQKPLLGGRPNTKLGDHGTPIAHNLWFILLQELVEGMVTYDFTLHLRIRDYNTWVWRWVGTAFGHFLLGSHNFMVRALGSYVKWPLGNKEANGTMMVVGGWIYIASFLTNPSFKFCMNYWVSLGHALYDGDSLLLNPLSTLEGTSLLQPSIATYPLQFMREKFTNISIRLSTGVSLLRFWDKLATWNFRLTTGIMFEVHFLSRVATDDYDEQVFF